MNRYEIWYNSRLKSRKRQDLISFLAAVLAVNISAMLAIFELRFGRFGGPSWSRNLSMFVLFFIATLNVAIVISPEGVGSTLVKSLKKITGSITGFLVAILLVMLFFLTLPLAAIFGRRGFITRHPASAPWVHDVEWRVATWQLKNVDIDGMNKEGSSTIARALALFINQRNFFLFIIALILLILSAFTIFAQTSPIAPFIYPLI